MSKNNNKNEVNEPEKVKNKIEDSIDNIILENISENVANTSKEKKSNRLIKKFFIILGLCLAIFFGVAYFIIFTLGGNKLVIKEVPIVNNGGSDITNSTKTKKTLAIKPPDIVKTILLMGVDEEANLSDTNMIIRMDTSKEQIDLLSIPRDTKIIPNEEMTTEFISDGLRVVESLRLSQLGSKAGKNSPKYIKMALEELLGVNIDYYIKIDMEAFMEIVDIVGGVEIYINENMDYEDPLGGLYIHFKEGWHTLDGKKAREAVRYRGYTSADIGRIQFQQQFLRELVEQALNKDTVISNLPELISLFFKYVDTDITVAEATRYISHVPNIKNYAINMYTMPWDNGEDYYILPIEDKLESLVEDIFYNKYEDTKSLDIRLLNSNNGSVYIKQALNFLAKEGFNILDGGIYQGNLTSETRIFVPNANTGKDLLKYFPDATLEVDEYLKTTDYSVVIVLGTEENKDFN